MKKRLFCNLKTLIPALGLAGATIFGGGCKDKNEPEITPNPIVQPDPLPEQEPEFIPPHDVTYEFGYNNFSAFKPIYYFSITVDSAEVENVFIKSDEKDWLFSPVSYIKKQIDEILMFASPENAYKVSGQGTLHQVYIDVISDSVKLSKFGFQFENTTRVLDPIYMSTKQKQK